MQNTTSIILSRMTTASRQIDVIANNIANVSTPGYQALHVRSASWTDQMRRVSAPPGGGSLAFTYSPGTWRSTRAGALKVTGNPLDLAVTGDGYFTVQTGQGVRLTRDGSFTLLANGSIGTISGNPLLDTSGSPIQVPPHGGPLTVAADGTVSDQTGILGQIGVVKVADSSNLVAAGGGLLQSNAPTQAVTQPAIVQGAIEGSNVQPVVEITRMMRASQNFQMLAQFISAEQSRSQTAISQLLGPANS